VLIGLTIGKGGGHLPLHEETPSQKRSGVARVVKGSHSFTCHLCVYSQMERTIRAFAFLAEAGPHLPTPKGWKAELP